MSSVALDEPAETAQFAPIGGGQIRPMEHIKGWFVIPVHEDQYPATRCVVETIAALSQTARSSG